MTVFEKNKIDSPDHFAAIFSHATIGILVTDGKGSINAVNPYALDEFGYTEKELLGKRVETLIPSRFHAKHRHVHAAFSKQPECRNMGQNKCLFAIRKDGTEFPVEISFNKYVSGGSEYILSFITNITERKGNEIAISAMQTELESTVKARTLDLTRALRKLEQTNQKLSEATAFQKAVLDNAGAMIIVTDAKGVIKLCNPEAAASLGYAAEELIDKATPEIIHIPEEIEIKKKILYEKYQFSAEHNFAALTELARRNIHNEEQFTYIRKDGSLFPVLLSITAIRNSDGVITGFMGVSVDISEWKRAEADLREALKKEKELNELKSRFLSMASHEFRSPLSTVLSSAYLIGKYASTEDQPRRERHLQRIVSSVTMLTDILNDFLDLGRIEEGKIQVRPTHFDIRELTSNTINEYSDNLKKGQEIHYRHEGEKSVFLDASLLKHIILNLISNASKFSGEDSSIFVQTNVVKHQLALSIRDEGIGISFEDQQHLMERFFRGSNAANIQGTGLGLNIVSKYAELMNGRVDCISELDIGTTFTITFNP